MAWVSSAALMALLSSGVGIACAATPTSTVPTHSTTTSTSTSSSITSSHASSDHQLSQKNASTVASTKTSQDSTSASLYASTTASSGSSSDKTTQTSPSSSSSHDSTQNNSTSSSDDSSSTLTSAEIKAANAATPIAPLHTPKLKLKIETNALVALTTQLDTTSSIVDINSVGTATIDHVNEVQGGDYQSVNAPDIYVAPAAQVTVKFTINKDQKLTVGEQIRIPLSQMPSGYAEGYIMRMPPNTIKFNGKDAFTLTFVTTTRNSSGEPTGGYWLLTIQSNISSIYTNITGTFNFDEAFEPSNGQLMAPTTETADNKSIGITVNGNTWSVPVHYRRLNTNNNLTDTAAGACRSNGVIVYNGVDWSALQNAYANNDNTTVGTLKALSTPTKKSPYQQAPLSLPHQDGTASSTT